ncbi:MAG TPA: DUF177 domain-containing protein [Longimicrobiaceae bacterium]|nr:DUF177 domain-containing protein [Longimicrobiaceae bacterium]
MRVRDDVPPDHPMWQGSQVSLAGPLHVDLTARSVGEGVFLRGTVGGTLRLPCRRCLAETEHRLDETVDFLFDEIRDDEEEEMEGEVYPLPERGDELDLTDAVREQVLLRVPQYVLCREECRGLCPRCGADMNEAPCGCGPEEEDSPWVALKKIKFD